MIRWWVFHEEQLAVALAAFEARRMQEGASEQQAKDDVATVLGFLGGPEARDHHLLGGA